jgi:hypothetical protein
VRARVDREVVSVAAAAGAGADARVARRQRVDRAQAMRWHQLREQVSANAGPRHGGLLCRVQAQVAGGCGRPFQEKERWAEARSAVAAATTTKAKPHVTARTALADIGMHIHGACQVCVCC